MVAVAVAVRVGVVKVGEGGKRSGWVQVGSGGGGK